MVEITEISESSNTQYDGERAKSCYRKFSASIRYVPLVHFPDDVQFGLC